MMTMMMPNESLGFSRGKMVLFTLLVFSDSSINQFYYLEKSVIFEKGLVRIT